MKFEKSMKGRAEPHTTPGIYILVVLHFTDFTSVKLRPNYHAWRGFAELNRARVVGIEFVFVLFTVCYSYLFMV